MNTKLFQKFTSWKTQRKHVNQANVIYIAIEKLNKTDLLYLITVCQANIFTFNLKRKWNFVP